MMQISSALNHFHEQKKYFDFGNLCEENIYLSPLFSTLYIDPGFYYDIDNDEYPDYYDPPENVTSEKGDIYSTGFIFFRLMTRLKKDEIEEIFKKKSTKNFVGKIKNLRRSPINSIEPPYFNNIKEELSKIKVKKIHPIKKSPT